MPGDRVMLVSESRPECNVADAALMAIRAVPVPTYTTNTVADHAHILRDSAARGRPSSPPPRWPRGWREAARRHRRARPAGLHGRRGRDAGPPARWAEAMAEPGDLPMLMAEVEQIPAGRARLPDLHLRHRRHPARRHAAAPRHAGELGRRARADRAAAARGRALPLLPAAVAQLRAHGRLLPAALDGHGGGLFARRRAAGRRIPGDPADHRHRRAAAVRGAAGAHAGAGREGEPGCKRRLFDRALAQGLRRMDGPPLSLGASGCSTRCSTGWCGTRCGPASAAG